VNQRKFTGIAITFFSNPNAMKIAFFLLFFMALIVKSNAQNPMGIFTHSQDVGNPKHKGSVRYDEQLQQYTIQAGGYNIWFGRDEFQYAFRKIKGDFILTANVQFAGQGVDPHRKVGWMVRQTLDDNSPHVSATVHGDGLTTLQWRPLKGALMRDPEDEIRWKKSNPYVIQLERQGYTYTMRAAPWGEPLQLVGTHTLEILGNEVFAGLFVSAHHDDAVEEARAWNVRIDRPVPDSYSPYRDGFLGSRLEIINVFDGKRKIIHTHSGSFEAPNWMPDGNYLLYNQGGLLYKIPVAGGTPEVLNTDFRQPE
jgi:TolB protein